MNFLNRPLRAEWLVYPEPTPYDVRFRMFGTPVRVHPGFWCVQCTVGLLWAYPNRPLLFLVWVGGAFVSILIH